MVAQREGTDFLKTASSEIPRQPLRALGAVRAVLSALPMMTQLLHCWPQFSFKTNASSTFPNSMPALRQSPGAESMRIVL